MNITPIPDREAAQLLGVSYGAIRQAVARGDLTRIPTTGQVQHVAKEQATLFQGKKMLHAKLDSKDRQIWEDIEAAILGRPKVASQPAVTPPTPVSAAKSAPAPSFNLPVEWMREHNTGVRVTPLPNGEMVFQPALADNDNALFFAFLLLGLIWLSSHMEKMTSEDWEELERALSRIGLETETLEVNQREAIAAFMQNPREAHKLKHIIDKSGYENPFVAA